MRYEESPVPTIVLIMVIASFAATAGTQAEEPTDPVFLQRRAMLATGKEVHGDYFAFGPDVEISGIVNGDVYAAGGDVLVDGVINGDLIVTGGDDRHLWDCHAGYPRSGRTGHGERSDRQKQYDHRRPYPPEPVSRGSR